MSFNTVLAARRAAQLAAWKDPVVLAVASAGLVPVGVQTLQAVALLVGDRVLVTDGVEGGIRIVQAGTWARAEDASKVGHLRHGSTVRVLNGASPGVWKLTTATTIDPGVTNQTWTVDASGGGGGGVGDITEVTVSSPLTGGALSGAANIALPAATASAAGHATAAQIAKLDGIAPGATANAGTVTGVTGTSPIVSSGGAAPAISITPATTGAAGSMSAADFLKLAGVEAGAQVTSAARVLTALAAAAGPIAVNAQRVTGVAEPTVATDAATKAYVDSAVVGIDWKPSVRAATTAAITLSGAQTVDGVALVAGDFALVKDQVVEGNTVAQNAANGLYVVAAGAWTRRSDADTSAEVTGGLAVFVNEGTANGNTVWICTANDPLVLGTDILVFTQFGAGGAPADGSITMAKLANIASPTVIGKLTAGAGVPYAVSCVDTATATTVCARDVNADCAFRYLVASRLNPASGTLEVGTQVGDATVGRSGGTTNLTGGQLNLNGGNILSTSTGYHHVIAANASPCTMNGDVQLRCGLSVMSIQTIGAVTKTQSRWADVAAGVSSTVTVMTVAVTGAAAGGRPRTFKCSVRAWTAAGTSAGTQAWQEVTFTVIPNGTNGALLAAPGAPASIGAAIGTLTIVDDATGVIVRYVNGSTAATVAILGWEEL